MLRRAPARPKSNLSFLKARILAGPFPGGPLGMVPDPLGDVGLRSHHALIERALPRELKIFFLAIGRIGDGTDGQDDFDHSDGLYPKTKLENVTPNSSSRLELPVGGSLDFIGLQPLS
jgi:hypothetical protein